MIPILYGTSETTFTSQGKGRLFDAATCVVTEELNGIYELEFTYHITGYLYNEMITNGGIVYCTHDDSKTLQAFDIYKYSAPINGLVTFYAHHISYRLNKIVVQPFTATSCADAVSKIVTNSMQTNPFTFNTDKTVGTPFELTAPM
jgi:phage-related protein